MIKKLITLAIMAVFLIAAPIMAEDMYIGVGGVYAFENFDVDENYSDTEGLNLKAGYVINENVAVELNYDYLPDFKWTGDVISADLDIETLMIAGKITTGKEVKPYLVGGIGVMKGILTASTGQSESETDLCLKAGAGVDYFVVDNVSVGVEGAYVWGFDELDIAEYTTVTCGASYHF